MREAGSDGRTQLERAVDALLSPGHVLFSLAIIALGIETLVCAGSLVGTLIQSDRFGTIIGPVLAAGGVGLLFKRTMRTAAMALGSLLLLYTLIFEVPRYAAHLGSMSSAPEYLSRSRLRLSLGSCPGRTQYRAGLRARAATCWQRRSSCLEWTISSLSRPLGR